MKKFCKSLREHAQRIVGFEKKKMLPLTKSNNHTKMQKCVTFVENIS